MPVISLSCRSCGASLQIRDGVEALACGHCGASMTVGRGGGAISRGLERALGTISTGAAKTAAELALVRLGVERERKSRQLFVLQARADADLIFSRQGSRDVHVDPDFF